MLISVLTIWSQGCDTVSVPTDSCVGFDRINVGERVVVGSQTYADMYRAEVDLYAYPGSVLRYDLAIQIKNHNDFFEANCR